MARPSVAASPGRPKGRFVQHRRLDRLRTALEREPAGMTLERLAEFARVSTRSARRYLRELERTMDIESVPTTPGGVHLWRLRAGERARNIPLRPAQARLLAAALPVFEPLRGSAVFEEASLLGEELRTFFSRRTQRNVRGTKTHDSALWIGHLDSARPAFGEITDTMIQAAADSMTTWVRLKEAPQLRRRCEAYAVLVAAGRVYVTGTLDNAADPEVFGMDRIIDADRSEETFRVPDGFDVNVFFHGEQGVSHTTAGECTLALDPEAAEALRGRRLHPSQRVATARDGRARVRLPYISLETLYRLIAPFGVHVSVLEPTHVRAGVAQIAERLASHHAAAVIVPTAAQRDPGQAMTKSRTTRVAGAKINQTSDKTSRT